jgi:hypothetical protein
MTHPLHSEPNLPNDAELDRFTSYVGGFMTEAEMADFDEQLASDEALYHRMAPMLKAWYTPTPAPSIMQAGARINQRRRQVRWHVLTALGSAASIKPLMVAAGLAAASVTFAYLKVQRERGVDNAAPRAVAVIPADTTPKLPKQGPPAKAAAVATNTTTKRPHRTKRIAPPMQESQVAVIPVLPADSAEASPPLPPLTVAFTPSEIARNDTLTTRGTAIGPGPRDLGGIQIGLPIPGALTGRGAPGALPMPKGGISRVPVIGRIWDWLHGGWQ